MVFEFYDLKLRLLAIITITNRFVMDFEVARNKGKRRGGLVSLMEHVLEYENRLYP
jgi:hypothetical protein